MRIAISGTHFSGKSTLVEALSEVLPHYTTVEEPYYLLAEEGYEFAELPSLEDFEHTLERSIENLDESVQNVIFDRCPADILGYLLTHADAEAFDLEEWLPRVKIALRKLDLIVFLPIEKPDRIVLPLSQDAAYRLRVDEEAPGDHPGELIRLRGGRAGGHGQSAGAARTGIGAYPQWKLIWLLGFGKCYLSLMNGGDA